MRDLLINVPPFTVAEVIQLLSLGNRTGLLTVTSKTNFCKVYFKNGAVIYVVNTKDRQRIGAKLVSYGKITQADLDKAVETQKASGTTQRLGHYLRDLKLITEDDLQQVIMEQVKDGIYNLFEWDSGNAVFDNLQEPSGIDDTHIKINIMSLMMEASRRVDEWDRIKTVLKSMDQIVAITGSLDDYINTRPPNRASIDIHIMKQINGVKPLRDIVKETGFTDFEIAELIYDMIINNVAKVVGEAPPLPPERVRLTT